MTWTNCFVQYETRYCEKNGKWETTIFTLHTIILANIAKRHGRVRSGGHWKNHIIIFYVRRGKRASRNVHLSGFRAQYCIEYHMIITAVQCWAFAYGGMYRIWISIASYSLLKKKREEKIGFIYVNSYVKRWVAGEGWSCCGNMSSLVLIPPQHITTMNNYA